MQKTKDVASYIEAHPEWEDLLSDIADTIAQTALKAEIKWGVPTYTFQAKNLVGIAAFKQYAGFWFHQGALLADPHNKLIKRQ